MGSWSIQHGAVHVTQMRGSGKSMQEPPDLMIPMAAMIYGQNSQG